LVGHCSIVLKGILGLDSGLLAIPWVIKVVFREEKRWGSYAHTLEIEMSKSLTFW